MLYPPRTRPNVIPNEEHERLAGVDVEGVVGVLHGVVRHSSPRIWWRALR
jgi:hypothetical protein